VGSHRNAERVSARRWTIRSKKCPRNWPRGSDQRYTRSTKGMRVCRGQPGFWLRRRPAVARQTDQRCALFVGKADLIGSQQSTSPSTSHIPTAVREAGPTRTGKTADSASLAVLEIPWQRLLLTLRCGRFSRVLPRVNNEFYVTRTTNEGGTLVARFGPTQASNMKVSRMRSWGVHQNTVYARLQRSSTISGMTSEVITAR